VVIELADLIIGFDKAKSHNHVIQRHKKYSDRAVGSARPTSLVVIAGISAAIHVWLGLAMWR